MKRKISGILVQGILAVILVFSLTSASITPGYASSSNSGSTCENEYIVQWGDTLYKIGLKFGVSWPVIAANNGIGSPYWVYAGQRICISGASSGTVGSSGVSVSVLANIVDKNVTIKTSSLPRNEIFDIMIGTCANTGIAGAIVGKIKTDGAPGVYTEKVKIPKGLMGVSCLAVRISSRYSSQTGYATFSNGTDAGGPVMSALDLKVNSVVKNKSVTVTISNAVKGKKYKVYITTAGNGASGGTYVATYIPATNKPETVKYLIPSKYKGASKLDIRVEGVTTSGIVYHTFNNTTH
jgi:hypothetical protein